MRIVSDALWAKVQAVQLKPDPRREAISKGIANRKLGKGSAYWLGGIIVCGTCGANYVGYGKLDYACPSHTSDNCGNDLRFRRGDIHVATFYLLKEHLLSDDRVERARQRLEALLKQREREEELAARQAAKGVDLRKLDKEMADLHRMGLRPAALAAGLAEIEREKQELLAKAAGHRDQRGPAALGSCQPAYRKWLRTTER